MTSRELRVGEPVSVSWLGKYRLATVEEIDRTFSCARVVLHDGVAHWVMLADLEPIPVRREGVRP